MVRYVFREIPELNSGTAGETGELERVIRKRNTGCSGEMRRYPVEHLRRKRLTSALLTLKPESVGIKQD